MHILLPSHAFNGPARRIRVELASRGHGGLAEIDVHCDLTPMEVAQAGRLVPVDRVVPCAGVPMTIASHRSRRPPQSSASAAGRPT